MQQSTACITPPSRYGVCSPPEAPGTTRRLLWRPPPCRESRGSPRSLGAAAALGCSSRHPGHSPCRARPAPPPLLARTGSGSRTSWPPPRAPSAPALSLSARARAPPSAPAHAQPLLTPGAAAPAQAHSDSETGAEKAAFIEGMRRSEAQAEVHSHFTQTCPRRFGASHRGALGGLRLLLAVLRFHGGEEQNLLRTAIASAAAPSDNATSHPRVPPELP